MPLQHEQRQAVHAEQLGCLVSDSLILKSDTGFDAHGNLKNVMQRASKLSAKELEEKVAGVTRQVLPPSQLLRLLQVQ